MEIARIEVTGAMARVRYRNPIPAGLVGGTVTVDYSEDIWKGLTKTVVFRSVETRDVVTDETAVTIPHETVAEPGRRLYVGFYGTDKDGALVIPTIWADLGMIRDATDPSGDVSTDPSLPVYAQLAQQIGDLRDQVENMTPGSPGGGTGSGQDCFSPIASVAQTEDGAVITITDKDGTTTATIANGKDGKDGADGAPGAKGDKGDKGDPGEKGEQGIQGIPGEKGEKGDTGAPGADGAKGDKGDTGATGPQGEPGKDGADGQPGKDGKDGEPGKDGADGKSAYEYAKDGGYTGTEDEFARKIAQEIPTVLPNPHSLIINGRSYDGSTAVEMNIAGGGEMVLSDNLFDKSTAVLGKAWYHSSSGTQLTDAAEFYAGYVELRGAGTYRTKMAENYHGESYGTRVPLMTADKTWIKNITGTVTDTGDNTAWDLEFTVSQSDIDSGAAYYPITVYKNNIDTVMAVKDRDYPTEYIPYGYIEIGTDVDSAGLLSNVLYEKTAVFLGDSICAGDIEGSEYDGYGWAGLIGEANGMAWKNYGRNGGTITPIESVVAQSRDLSSQVDLALADHPNADYVIFEGGTNDAYTLKEAGLGEISDDFATFDTSTFSGAMESLILKILTAFPNAQVGYIVAQKMGNPPYTTANIQRKYFDRAVEICQKWGIPVIDLWNGSLLNPALTYHAENFYVDKQHLTLVGYQRISPQIEAWMRNLTMPGVVSGGGSGSAEAVPADWNAAEGEPGHVLNRTHWSEYDERVLMAETAVEFTEENEYFHIIEGNLTVGFRYRVKWNNVEYVCVCKHGGEDIPAYIGEEALIGGSGHTGEPFFAANMDGMIILTPASDDTHATVDIVEIAETVHTLPKKYLPAESYIVRDITESGGSFVVNESYDNFAEILYNGGRVWVEVVWDGNYATRVLICFFTLNDGGMIMQGYLNGEAVFFYATNGTWTPHTA